MRFLIACMVYLFLAHPVSSQNQTIGVRYGFGLYFMTSLEDLQELRRHQVSELSLKTTESFPVSPFYRFEVAGIIDGKTNKLGGYYTYNSTGARSTLSDYSGRYAQDAIVNGHQIGLTFDKKIWGRGTRISGLYADAGYIFTRLKLSDHMKLVYPQSYIYDEEYKLGSSGFTIEPGIFYQIEYKRFHFRFNLGGLMCIAQQFYLSEDKNQKLFAGKEEVRPGWSGFRMGIQVELKI